MAANRRHQVQNAATLTASGNSGMLPNLGESSNPTVIVYIDVTGAVTNGGGTLQVTVYGSSDGSRTAQLAQDATINATLSGPHRLVIHDVLDPNIEVAWVIGGTTPSYAGVNIDVYMTSPDA